MTVTSDSLYDVGLHLNFTDVTVNSYDNPKVIKVRVKASKTDPYRLGVDTFLGRTHKDLCPVAAVLSYMLQRDPGSGPLFKFIDIKPMTRPRFVSRIRKALSEAGVNCAPYSGHSFRTGVATTTARQGIEEVEEWCILRVVAGL